MSQSRGRDRKTGKRKLKEESMGEKEGACAFVAADGEGSVAVYWTSEASGHRALQGVTDLTEWIGVRLAAVCLLQRHSSGRARSGSGRVAMAALVWFATSPVRVRLLLPSFSGDDYPRCLPGSLRQCLSLEAYAEREPESMKFAADCRLQVKCGCGADEPTNGCRRS